MDKTIISKLSDRSGPPKLTKEVTYRSLQTNKYTLQQPAGAIGPLPTTDQEIPRVLGCKT